jgi:hypothetical protein
MNLDSDGFRYWHIATHGKAELLRHMNEPQKIAVALMEKWGWTLHQLDEGNHRQAYMRKAGEMTTCIGRME